MNESVFIAVMLALLAFSGVQPTQAQTAKFCKSGYVAHLIGSC